MGARKSSCFMRNDRKDGNGGWLVWCTHCGQDAFVVLPLPMSMAIAATNAFDKDHRRCPKPKDGKLYVPPPVDSAIDNPGEITFLLGMVEGSNRPISDPDRGVIGGLDVGGGEGAGANLQAKKPDVATAGAIDDEH